MRFPKSLDGFPTSTPTHPASHPPVSPSRPQFVMCGGRATCKMDTSDKLHCESGRSHARAPLPRPGGCLRGTPDPVSLSLSSLPPRDCQNSSPVRPGMT